MNETIVITLAGIGLIAIVCQWLAWRVKLPAILFLLVAGIVAGPVSGWLNPETLFGGLLFPIVSLSVAVILFEGSLTLKFTEIRGLERVVRRLVTSGLLVTWAVTTVITHWALEFPWDLSLLFGAVTVVTGPTVIIPMLRTVRPTAKLASILRWEGIVIDPIGALLAVLVFEFIISGSNASGLFHTFLTFGQTLAAGIAIGVAAGYYFGISLRRHWLPEYLHNVAALTLVFAAYAAADAMQAESGLLAVSVMGVWLANMPKVPIEDILDFKESLSILLISGLFIILAARIDVGQVHELGWGAAWIFLGIQFIARPLKVLSATWGSPLSWRERALLSWIAPRGIVAAAVAALFALRLEEQGYAQAHLLVPLTFIVIIGTVALQSASARALAVILGVGEPEPRGFLIIGASPLARAIARVLNKQGFDTLLTDPNWDHVRAARMDGLKAYYGQPVSEHADRHLDLVGLGRMLALSPQREQNTLAALRYRNEFGAANIYTLLTTSESKGSGASRNGTPKIGHIAFGRDLDYDTLSGLLSAGADIRATALTENFTYDDYYRKYFGHSTRLFALNPAGRLLLFTAETDLKLAAGWTLISLIEKKPEPETGKGSGKTSGADVDRNP
jgi:NhaP-type Na+/H+ or K+/H+ antiporter